MTGRTNRRSIFDLARMLPMKPNAWLVLAVSLDKREPAIAELLAELAAGEVPARRLHVGDDREAWVQQIQNPPDDFVILDGFDQWTAHDWQEADYLRSRLSRPGPQVWLLALNGIDDLVRSAPNLASFIGGNVFAIGQDDGLLSGAEIAERLSQYRRHYAMTDKELIEKASKRQLPWEPEFAEWLALLGRGDLIP